MNNLVYIYNLEQAYFYIREGLTPEIIDKHFKTGKVFFAFNRKQSNNIYTKWLEREH